VDETPLAQRLGEGLLDRGDQAGGAVADNQQRGCQAPADSPLPGARPMNAGLPPVVMPQAASDSSALAVLKGTYARLVIYTGIRTSSP
jgi:hypothetical protein